MRAEVLGIALMRYASDRREWNTLGFKPFVTKAHSEVLEGRAAAEKDANTKSSGDSMRAQIMARDEAAKRALEAKGAALPTVNPESLVKQLTERVALPHQPRASA